MKRIILTALLISLAMPVLATAAEARQSPPLTEERKRPNPAPKPGPRDDGEGDQ